MCYSEQVTGRPVAPIAPRHMDHTAQALLALSLLRSLPNWSEIAEIYGDIDEHLGDLVDDLTNHPWEELS